MSFISQIITRVRNFKRKVVYYMHYWSIRRFIAKRKGGKDYADFLFYETFGHYIDWDNPRDLNEVINYLEFCTDTTEWTRLSDKLLVRDYVKSKGLEDILVPLLGVWDDARLIDFDSLPNKFVLKCNHDSGSTHIIDKEKGFDKELLIKELNERLTIKYGFINNEPHYNAIQPKIIAEQFIDLDAVGLSSSPIDYKVFCYNGNPDVIWVAYNRCKESVYHETRDTNWTHKDDFGADDFYYRKGNGIIPKPLSLDRMLSAARLLSQGLPQVRVDFYDVNGTLYFGEMTFTSDCGRMPFFSKEYLKAAGAKIDLSLAKNLKKY